MIHGDLPTSEEVMTSLDGDGLLGSYCQHYRSDVPNRWIWIEHKDSVIIGEIDEISMEKGGGMYMETRKTELKESAPLLSRIYHLLMRYI